MRYAVPVQVDYSQISVQCTSTAVRVPVIQYTCTVFVVLVLEYGYTGTNTVRLTVVQVDYSVVSVALLVRVL